MAGAEHNLTDLASALPLATTSAMYVLGLPLAQWVVILNFVYIFGLITLKITKAILAWRRKRNGCF